LLVLHKTPHHRLCRLRTAPRLRVRLPGTAAWSARHPHRHVLPRPVKRRMRARWPHHRKEPIATTCFPGGGGCCLGEKQPFGSNGGSDGCFINATAVRKGLMRRRLPHCPFWAWAVVKHRAPVSTGAQGRTRTVAT
jgi:hypothetical protein